MISMLPNRQVIRVGEIEIGGRQPVFIAGPCAVESRGQLWRIAAGVKQAGAHILRGGIFKPRTSVHSFQGVGAKSEREAVEALGWLKDAGQAFAMPTITEVRCESHIALVAPYSDILQIGARNMYNQDLLVAVARQGKPILFKRHFGATLEEFLSFAEYITDAGNADIILCERGILSFGKGQAFARYTPDIVAVPILQRLSRFPVVVDPSHATGRRNLVFPMSCAAIAAGACGLMIEVHYAPAEALSDGEQMITPDEFAEVVRVCRLIHAQLPA
jgi:3-deoxy-7-phosphoheptulonate synthase